ncbi:HMG-box, partial [Pilatotrama ljubarskyi]
PGYVKRPENAFILFRRDYCRKAAAACANSGISDFPKKRQADLSKESSAQWRALPPVQREYWHELAKAKAEEHKAVYPDYVYRPVRKPKA